MTALLVDPIRPGPVLGPVDPIRPGPVLVPVDRLRPDVELSVDELGSRIVGLAGRLAAATCRWLLLVARFDAREGCACFGLASTARWLSHSCGIAHRTAIDHVRVARALAGFPALAAAMAAGRLSYTHARAIARVAGEGEDQLVAELIEVAEHGTAEHLETMVRGLRTVEHNDEGVADRPEDYVRHSWASNSQWQLQARLAPERGAVVEDALEQLARADGVTQAEALLRMAEIALAAVNDSEHPPRPLRGHERAAVVIHLDATATGSASAEAADDAEVPRSAERDRPAGRIADGPGLPRSVVERLLCAGRIRTAVHDGQGNVLNLGRSHRVVSERQFRALLMKYEGHCAHPGCPAKARLEAHHVRHWLHGGRTDMCNLLLLCERHHHAHHDGEFSIMKDGSGRFRFLRADGRELEHVVDPTRLADRAGPIEDEHTLVSPTAAHTRWNGDRLERHWAVSILVERRNRAAG